MNRFSYLTIAEQQVVVAARGQMTDQMDAQIMQGYIEGECEGLSYGFIQEYLSCEIEGLTKPQQRAHITVLRKLYKDCENDGIGLAA